MGALVFCNRVLGFINAPALMQHIVANLQATTVDVAEYQQKRDFLYVTDVANAFLKAALIKDNEEVFNLGAGNPQTIKYLIELLGGQFVNLPKRPGEPDITWANIKKITKKTGWRQKVSFEDGVKKMIENIDYWKDAPLWDKESIELATRDWFKFLK